jgi:hypothetical protein
MKLAYASLDAVNGDPHHKRHHSGSTGARRVYRGGSSGRLLRW